MKRNFCAAAAENSKAQTELKKVIVFGGNGYVGQNVCQYALGRGAQVISINRSGRPSSAGHWASEVTWIRGDIFRGDEWRDHLRGATGVVSCVGAFGNNEVWLRI